MSKQQTFLDRFKKAKTINPEVTFDFTTGEDKHEVSAALFSQEEKIAAQAKSFGMVGEDANSRQQITVYYGVLATYIFRHIKSWKVNGEELAKADVPKLLEHMDLTERVTFAVAFDNAESKLGEEEADPKEKPVS